VGNRVIDFSFSGLLASFIFGVLGLYAFKYGRKFADFRFISIGLALIVFPYFTSGAMADWGVGITLCALGYYLKVR